MTLRGNYGGLSGGLGLSRRLDEYSGRIFGRRARGAALALDADGPALREGVRREDALDGLGEILLRGWKA